jgi:hypothetical protein
MGAGAPEVDRFAHIQVKREGARRARRLAWGITDELVRERMLAFADELEAEADALAWHANSMEASEAKAETVQ